MRSLLPIAAATLAAACAHMPDGPTTRVMPAPYKPFELFQADDRTCRDYARSSLEGAPQQAQSDAVAAAAVGTAVGAAVGAMAGGSSEAASTGAGVGLAVGAAEGANVSGRASWTLQRRYDFAYEQCMYAKGNQVPGYAPISMPPPPPPAAPPQPRRPGR